MNNWETLSSRFSALQQREKKLIFYVSMGLIIYLFVWFVLLPKTDSLDNIERAHAEASRDLYALTVQQDALEQALTVDYQTQLQTTVDDSIAAISQVNAQLDAINEGFVGANNMPELLMTLLNEQPALTPLQFNVLGTDVIRLGDDPEADVMYYRHNMVLSVEGDYFSLRAYLESLQQANQKVAVTSFDYQVDTYPTARLTLNLATVSSNETFISL
ncbi:agglutinin biogenesis protein MshJ [Alteromonas sp. A079]|uniref:agglutinin biogenesis protein MshJ n=1 Tax=Alteromonas sp. A079 TaxID=3410268 RepID=UPI003BA36DF9